MLVLKGGINSLNKQRLPAKKRDYSFLAAGIEAPPWPLLLLLLLFSPAASSATVCPPGQFDTVGTKRLYWDAGPVTWEDARAGCPPNSTLAVVESAAEMAAMAAKGDAGKRSSINFIHIKYTGWRG